MMIGGRRLWLQKQMLLYAVYTAGLQRREKEHPMFIKILECETNLAD